MRIMIKGGVWKNTEDEILKAAVMKYGKNQWARISSLLVRKSPKQCKARWYEWLDPSIKKTEWSKEEDEKLLHLAKLMPTQWRTIAPFVGRTPAQCLERYHKLLDEAEQKEGEEGAADVATDDVRKLKPGEVDPDPEARPAKPDPVDMDEDEKEMLSEARARLANTQGKKAKRKARERQLEEARRLAALQKKRELKAAGIDVRQKRKRRFFDYNAEVPFEHRPAPGFFDTGDELQRSKEPNFDNIYLAKLEQRRRRDVEEDEKKKDVKRRKIMKEKGMLPDVSSQVRKLGNEAEVSKRPALLLPAPQVNEHELEEIVKLGYAGETTKSIVAGSSELEASQSLVGSYTNNLTATPMRTPLRTPTGEDTVKREAQNLLALTRTQTPLLGGINTPLHATSFEGVTPKRIEVRTPNPVAAMTPRAGGAGAGGIVGGQTPMRTPMRDEFGINTVDAYMAESTPRAEKARMEQIRRRLEQGFSSLPAPKNDFEIVLPASTATEDDDVSADSGTASRILDASERDRQIRERQQREHQAELSKRSTVLQRDLPRPIKVRVPDLPENEGTDSEISAMIRDEMERIMTYDLCVAPPAGAKVAPGKVSPPQMEAIPEDTMSEAKRLISEEVEKILREENLTIPEIVDMFAARDSESTSPSSVSELQSTFKSLQSHISSFNSKSEKVHKKLQVTLGGYSQRSHKLRKRIHEVCNEIRDKAVEKASFAMLEEQEQDAIKSRIELLEREVRMAAEKNGELQERYAKLWEERRAVTVNGH